MEKWKKKILKAIYRQWIKADGVSAGDMVGWLNNPDNCMELYSGILDCSKKSYLIRLKYFFVKWYELI